MLNKKIILILYDIYRKIDSFLLPTFDKYKRDIKKTNKLKFLLKHHHNICNNIAKHFFSYRPHIIFADIIAPIIAPYYIIFFIKALASIIKSKAILHAAVLI